MLAYRSLASFRGDGRPGAWLTRIATRECWRRAAVRARRAAATTALDDMLIDTLPGAASPLGDVLAAEERTRVRGTRRDPGEPYREVVALRFFGELSLLDIGAATGRPEGTVKAQLHRGAGAAATSPRPGCRRERPATPRPRTRLPPQPGQDPAVDALLDYLARHTVTTAGRPHRPHPGAPRARARPHAAAPLRARAAASFSSPTASEAFRQMMRVTPSAGAASRRSSVPRRWASCCSPCHVGAALGRWAPSASRSCVQDRARTRPVPSRGALDPSIGRRRPVASPRRRPDPTEPTGQAFARAPAHDGRQDALARRPRAPTVEDRCPPDPDARPGVRRARPKPTERPTAGTHPQAERGPPGRRERPSRRNPGTDRGAARSTGDGDDADGTTEPDGPDEDGGRRLRARPVASGRCVLVPPAGGPVADGPALTRNLRPMDPVSGVVCQPECHRAQGTGHREWRIGIIGWKGTGNELGQDEAGRCAPGRRRRRRAARARWSCRRRPWLPPRRTITMVMASATASSGSSRTRTPGRRTPTATASATARRTPTMTA